jgi:hypothetical protein
VNSGAPEWLAVPAIRRVNVKRHQHYLIWKSCWTQVIRQKNTEMRKEYDNGNKDIWLPLLKNGNLGMDAKFSFL